MTGWAASSTKIRGATLRRTVLGAWARVSTMQAFLGNFGGVSGVFPPRLVCGTNPSQKYLKFSDQVIWLSLSVG
jgi:hypothetical protein